MKTFRMLSAACLAMACSAAFAQVPPAVAVSDQAVYQSNVPQGVSPATPPMAQPAIPGAPAAAVMPGTPAVAPPAAPPAGTARDQGYTGDMGVSLSAWDQETLRRLESPRQRGERVEVFARRNGVATDPVNAAWFQAWSMRLVSIGVHPDKVKFEGKRLTKEEFAMWASRQVWATEAGLIAP